MTTKSTLHFERMKESRTFGKTEYLLSRLQTFSKWHIPSHLNRINKLTTYFFKDPFNSSHPPMCVPSDLFLYTALTRLQNFRFWIHETELEERGTTMVAYISHFVRIHILKIETKGKDTCGQHNTVSYLPVCYTV